MCPTATPSKWLCIEHITQIVPKCRHHYSLMIPGLHSANTEYSEKVSAKSSNEKTLHTLGWTVDELSRLDQTGRRLTVEIQQVIQTLKRGLCASDVQTRVHFVCENTSQFFFFFLLF